MGSNYNQELCVFAPYFSLLIFLDTDVVKLNVFQDSSVFLLTLSFPLAKLSVCHLKRADNGRIHK